METSHSLAQLSDIIQSGNTLLKAQIQIMVQKIISDKKAPYILAGCIFAIVECILIEECPPLAGFLFNGALAATPSLIIANIME